MASEAKSGDEEVSGLKQEQHTHINQCLQLVANLNLGLAAQSPEALATLVEEARKVVATLRASLATAQSDVKASTTDVAACHEARSSSKTAVQEFATIAAAAKVRSRAGSATTVALHLPTFMCSSFCGNRRQPVNLRSLWRSLHH